MKKIVEKTDEKNKYFMYEALKEAQKAYDKLEVPIGVVIVKDGKVISRGYNMVESKNDPTRHAEIVAIQKACKKLNNWRLDGCDMYLTLEPCPMCAGAILNSRIKNVYIAAKEPRSGAAGSKVNLFKDYNFNHKTEYKFGICEVEASNLMKEFFKERRNEQKNKKC